MALPMLSKSGVAPVTFSRANVYPSVSPRVFNRFVGISDGSTVKVATVGVPLQTITLAFQQLTRTDLTNIEAFFGDSLVNWGAETFQFTDVNGTVHNVKYLEPQFALPEVADDNVSFELVLTKV